MAFINSPRDFIGAAAKTLGLPYNVTPAALRAAHVSEAQLTQRLRALRGQCRTFADADALAALKGRDVWAAVCPCDSAALVAARSTRLLQVAPASGTGLFADVWVQPRRAGGAALTAVLTAGVRHMMPCVLGGEPGDVCRRECDVVSSGCELEPVCRPLRGRGPTLHPPFSVSDCVYIGDASGTPLNMVRGAGRSAASCGA